MSGLIESFHVYPPLRDPELFCRVGIGEHGTDIVWTDELLSSSTVGSRLPLEATV
jgi:hypothetical protein